MQDHPQGFKYLGSGSSKEIYRAGKGVLAFQFTDFFSVFDVGRSSYPIPGKGKSVCDCAVKGFEIAASIGVPTHFIKRVDDTTILVREVQIIRDRVMTPDDVNYLIPAEWISRFKNAGSLERKFKSGLEKPENYGLPAGIIPATGIPFPYPIHQLTTKLEKLDRDMSEDELCNIGGISRPTIAAAWSMIDRLDGALALQAQKAGYHVLDGKKELAMGPDRRLMVIDVYLTPDEDRPAKIMDGTVEHHSKELLRQIFIEMGYKATLEEARKHNRLDPPIPQLTDEQLELVASRYIDFARAFVNA